MPSQPAVIDEVFAHKYLPGQNPIGKRITLNNSGKTMEIVGVVAAAAMLSRRTAAPFSHESAKNKSPFR